MKRTVLICGTLLLVIMSLIPLTYEKCPAPSYGTTQSGLQCTTDYFDMVTCEWNSSSVKDTVRITNCSLHGNYNDYSQCQNSTSELVPLNDPHHQILKATLKFQNVPFPNGSLYLSLYVLCGIKTTPVDSIPKFKLLNNIKIYPPEKPVVNGDNVTWRAASRIPDFLGSPKFHVQWKEHEQSWEGDQPLNWNTDLSNIELPMEKLVLGKKYMIRVRATQKAAEKSERIWSEWSPITEWTSTVGSPPNSVVGELLFGSMSLTGLVIFVSAMVILLVIFSIHCFRSIQKYSFIPGPSKYFDGLFSKHEGDFKSWLGPIVNPELYLKPECDITESVLPVLVFKGSDCGTLSGKSEKDLLQFDKNHGNSSSFCNSTYFLSQSSRCAVMDLLQPCSMDCPYGPTGGTSKEEKFALVNNDDHKDEESEGSSINSPMETSSSNKERQMFRLDVQSPDSGFAAGSEDQESQDESGSEGLPSPPVVGSTPPISHILQCPVPQKPGFPNPLFLPSLTWNPWINLPNTNMVPGISADILNRRPDFPVCSGMLEPSGDDYMPVQKV